MNLNVLIVAIYGGLNCQMGSYAMTVEWSAQSVHGFAKILKKSNRWCIMCEVPSSMQAIEEPRTEIELDYPNAQMKNIVISAMREVVEKQPIKNGGSCALRLLWQIFEEAEQSEIDEDQLKDINSIDDGIWEAVFKGAFPVFCNDYPSVMVLDRQR